MDGRNPVETRSKTPAHDIAQRCRLQPPQPNARYSPPPSWKSSSHLNPIPRRGTASNGPFERPLPQDTKKLKEKRSKACVQSRLNIEVIEKLTLGSKSCVLLQLVFKSKIDKDKYRIVQTFYCMCCHATVVVLLARSTMCCFP